ncbi:hypothetical protein GQ55_7G278100 [Panicum hallii var. hallii]|uniref:Uncharacterized protein n=1 Tax=Panicum hallii var. hallii TaxID=1504633 RepID=A0A2T7CZS5_9POAL|nr:hypothetical protein GQ55_7G278100 [Panicum hallii var. hallii]
MGGRAKTSQFPETRAARRVALARSRGGTARTSERVGGAAGRAVGPGARRWLRPRRQPRGPRCGAARRVSVTRWIRRGRRARRARGRQAGATG